jgi:ERCC4-type nuclease
MKTLIKEQMVRKEIVRNPTTGHSDLDKWGLLPGGETMGQCCAEFERAVREVIPREKIGARSSGKSMNVVLCMDTREDVHYQERLRRNCQDENVPFIEKELPAGDYLFLEESLDEMVPLVIERKSWSDLADSCLGKGLPRNRLGCVQLNQGYSSSCGGNCQLCKMKRCGCTQILFMIEGERCQGVQSNERCTVEKSCASCKLLVERHNVTQTELEGLLTRLQLEHGCYIHYTKNFNDTISSLSCIRALLQRNSSHSSRLLDQRGGDRSLSFEQYKTNAQRRGQDSAYENFCHPETVDEWDIQALVSMIREEWNDDTVRLLLGLEQSEEPKKRHKGDSLRLDEPITLDDDSDSDIEIVEPCRKQPEMICLDSDGDDDVVEVSAGSNLNVSDDSIIILDEPNAATEAKLSSKKASKPRHCNERKQSAKRKAHQMGGSDSNVRGNDGISTNSILMLHNLSNHEAKLGKCLDKIWKNAYNMHSRGDRDQFFERSLEMVTDSANAFSFVNGRTISSFGLWLQVVVGIHIRFVEECNNVATDLRSKLRSHASTTTQLSANRSLTSSITRCTPSSQYSTPQKSNASLGRIGSTMSSTGPEPTYSKNDQVREARLRRFEQPCAAANAPGRQCCITAMTTSLELIESSSTWSCQQCTLENELSAANCAACGFGIDAGTGANFGLQESTRLAPLKCPSTTYHPLRSFVASGSSALAARHTVVNSGWDCPRCTLQNDKSAVKCATCEYTYSGAVSEHKKPSHSIGKKRQRHSHANEPWLCEECMFENSMKDETCFDCGRRNDNHPNFNYGSEASAKKKIKCGACGSEGHNRASATASNCPAYYDDSEVERREKKEQKKLAEIVQARQAIESIENERETAGRVNEELLEKMEEMKRNNARAEQYRDDELKRQQAKLKRLEKQRK